ncbi:carbohydrate ABC transporter permease [Bifidobacterium simiarum]|uniref:carbohydrate ABC transporter permease n=1 Tax=Bifidobacterium simiarum TaxID=2045441 RepID=UPI001BDBBE47|nr:sugar ABC transporter permease [Bifidobacterium simiarum]MBT1166039.1 sugar ABC transporter permease [Bifidobacterium simiarum]
MSHTAAAQVDQRPTDSEGREPSHNKGKMSSAAISRRNFLHGVAFITPNFLGFIFLILIPVCALFYIANTRWSAFGNPVFTGGTNWRRLMRDSVFKDSFWNTIYYSVVHIPLTLVLAFGLAVLLNSKLKGRSFFRTVAFFPYITSIVAVAQVWNMLFDARSGVINQIIGIFTDNVPGWLGSTTWAMPAVIIVATWREAGYFMILLLAGLQTIPSELYEAAQLDGANAWQRFWKVTVPCMRPTLFFVMVTLTIGSFKILDLTLIMTGGGPGTSTLVLAQYVYKVAFERGDFGYSGTVSLVLFALCMVVTLIQFWYNNQKEK